MQRGWIEAAAGKFGFYAEGTRPAVAQVMEAIDHERLALAHALGARAVPHRRRSRLHLGPARNRCGLQKVPQRVTGAHRAVLVPLSKDAAPPGALVGAHWSG